MKVPSKNTLGHTGDLLSPLYSIRLGSIGLGMFVIKHAAPLVYILLGVLNVIATDLKQIQRRIERERQIEKIKTEIMKNLRNTGIMTDRNDHLPISDLNSGIITHHIDKQGPPDKPHYEDINRDNKHSETEGLPKPEEQRKPLISVGIPTGKINYLLIQV